MSAPDCAAILARLEPLRPVLEAMRAGEPWKITREQLDDALRALGAQQKGQQP